MSENHYNVKGLNAEQVLISRQKFGANTLNFKKENSFLDALKRIVKDPMIVILLVSSSIYFISGKWGDGIFLLVAIIFQTSISLFQFSRSKNALEKLKDFSQPHCKVIRNGKIHEIKSEELVVRDSILVAEGTAIPADAKIVQSNDFSVNESILTGESFAVVKDKMSEDKSIYSG